MKKLDIQLCPETGICSIIKGDGAKIDLMPDEVSGLREAAGKPDAIRKALADVDPGFAEALGAEELGQLSSELRQNQGQT
ncbi:MAG: hypothetical protein HYV35_11940 [Lentisphaerae bacterium]|nr:hypothetical protein [Lentisphaerota bacterium]